MGILCSGPSCVCTVTLGLLRPPDLDSGTPLAMFGLFWLFIFVVCAFQVFARQRPLLKIYQEGMEIRAIGAPIYISLFMNVLGFGTLLFLLIVFCQFITLQMFRIRTIRLRWDNVSVIPTPGTLAIGGWFIKNVNDDFGQETSLEYYAVSYEVASFRVSIGKVSEALLFFLHNPDSRETLPSWQNEETVFGNDAFDFQ